MAEIIFIHGNAYQNQYMHVLSTYGCDVTKGGIRPESYEII